MELLGPRDNELQLQCPNGNYLSSLVVVREENAPQLPIYVRQVAVPIGDLDDHGTQIPDSSLFLNRDRTVMVGHLKPSGIRSWEPHILAGRPKQRRRMHLPRCTFGLPRISPFGNSSKDSGAALDSSEIVSGGGAAAALSSCSRSRCACRDDIYDHLSQPRCHSTPPTALAVGSSSLRTFMEPLRSVPSHNLFQRLLEREAGRGVGGGKASERSAVSAGPGIDDTPTTAPSASQLRLLPALKDVPSLSSTTVSYSPKHVGEAKQPPVLSSLKAARRTKSLNPDHDLNVPARVRSELEEFERREMLRSEQEDFLKHVQSSGSLYTIHR